MKKKHVLLVTLTLFACCFLAGCGAKDGGAITSLDQLGRSGVKIGVASDLLEWKTLKQDYPKAEVIAYSDNPLAYQDVANGRLDAYIYSRRQMEYAIEGGTAGVRLLEEDYSKNSVAVGLSSATAIPELQEKINAFLAEQRSDGTLDDMFVRWVINGDKNMPAFSTPEHPALHLRVGTTGTVPPYSFYSGTELHGYDIELAYRFAAWLGADVEFKVYDFGGLISAAASGDVDCIMSNLFVTPERIEAIPFSDPVYEEKVTAMVRAAGASAAPASSELRWQDYNGKRLGVLIGTPMEAAAKQFFPDSEYLYFNSYPDCNAALLAGKIDAYLGDEPGLKTVHAEQPQIDYIHDRLTNQNYSFAFRKNDPESAALCEELNVFLAKIRADGTLQELDEIWMGVDEDRKVVDMSDLTDENGTIRVVTTSTDMPWSYIKDGKNVGYDIDLVVRFCRDRGYALELGDVDFSGRIPAIQSGKYDFTTDMNVTPEREEEVLFSEPTSSGGIVLAVLASDFYDHNAAETADASFWAAVKTSFEKTFLRENRWKLFAEGVGTTLLITILSILFGTMLGFGVFMLCRKGNPLANALTRFFVWLVQGMPMVVLLMILYYIIFGKVTISGTAVSVIGFTLVFGAAVYGMIRGAVATVDRGQTEAAYSLGYTDRRAFFRVVLPQAVPHFMPQYKGQITALIKATAIVGYVAVQDLTKMGDIVRSRTYDAFFPLIAVAVIYFVLAAILTFLVNRIEIRIDPKQRQREKILKGVKTGD